MKRKKSSSRKPKSIVIAGAGGERVMAEKRIKDKKEANDFSKQVGIALKRAAKRARKTARMHGVPIYVSKNGKVVAIKP